MSRVLKFARLLSALDSRYNAVIFSSDPTIRQFKAPARTEIASLPAISKLGGAYYAADNLDLSLAEVLRIRTEVMLGYARGLLPDYLVIDTFPGGVKGELLPVIDWVREHVPGIKIVYIARDILGPSEEIVPAWRALGIFELLERQVDKVLIFGEKFIFDWTAEYQIPSGVSPRIFYCGYFGCDESEDQILPGAVELTDILVTVGGGSDGAHLVRTALDAFTDPSLKLCLVLGPQMRETDVSALLRVAEGRSNVQVQRFVPELPRLLRRCRVIVAMAGFNTVNELLALGSRAVLVPRKVPTKEQFERARRLDRLGLLTTIDPEELSAEKLRIEVYKLLSIAGKRTSASLTFDTISRVKCALQ